MTDVVALIDGIESGCAKEGWDSYGAAPVTHVAAEAARTLVRSLYAVPTNRGGISLFFASEAITVVLDANGRLVEFYADIEEYDRYVASIVGPLQSSPQESGENADPKSAPLGPETSSRSS